MSVVITKEDLMAYSEVDYIIHHMNQKYIEKIPQKLLNFFDKIKDDSYEVEVNPRVPLQKQNLQKYTLQIIAILHIKYWCEDDDRKRELLQKMQENQNKLEEQMENAFDINNIFEEKPKYKGVEYKSEPPVITKYSEFTKENPDIQDFTDTEENLEQKNEELIKKSNNSNNIFIKIKEKIKKIFNKK